MLHTLRFLMTHPIGRRTRSATLARYVAWQVRCCLQPGPHRRSWIGPTCLMVRRGMSGATGNLYVGLHEFELMAFAMHLLRPGDCFVDVGANVGSHTVLAAGVCGASVLAFQPIAETVENLQLNISANNLMEKVCVVREAVGASPGKGSMTRTRDTTNRILPAATPLTDAVEVRMTTLDKALDGRGAALIKIDVEGHELPVLHGATATLQHTSAVIVEVGPKAAETLAVLQRAGFTSCSYGPFSHRLTPRPDLAIDDRGNAMFGHGVQASQDLCSTAQRRTVLGVAL